MNRWLGRRLGRAFALAAAGCGVRSEAPSAPGTMTVPVPVPNPALPPPALVAEDCGTESDANSVTGVRVAGRIINRCDFSTADHTAAITLSTVSEAGVLRADAYWAAADCAARVTAVTTERGPPDWQDCRRKVWRNTETLSAKLLFTAENGCILSSINPELLGGTETEWPWGSALPATSMRATGGAAWAILAKHTAADSPLVWGDRQGDGRYVQLSLTQLARPAITAAAALGQPALGSALILRTPPAIDLVYRDHADTAPETVRLSEGLLRVTPEPGERHQTTEYFAACEGLVRVSRTEAFDPDISLWLEPFWLP